MISVIVPTYNRANQLKLALESAVKQSLNTKEFEILVADNGSTDNTKEVVDEIAREFPVYNIRYIFEPEPGLLSGRHKGALEAKGDILVFIDDDIEADKDWLSAIKHTFDIDSSVQLVGGRNLPKYETQPPEWLRWFWNNYYDGNMCADLSLLDLGKDLRQIDANYVWGLNFSIRKSALFELGGFHPDCMPKHLQHFQGDGEIGLTMKANERAYKTVYQPRALIYHNILASRMTYEYFDNRYFYQGVCHSFTDIRRQHGKYKVEDYKQVRGKTTLQKIKDGIAKIIFGQNNMGKKLKERFRQAFINGYNFHQESVKNNPELLKWVLKDDYWDYKLPDFKLKVSPDQVEGQFDTGQI